MGKFTTVYNNFAGGKVSEKFKGRFDTQTYQNALEEMLNMSPDKIGGAFKRTGSLLAADLSNVSASFDDGYTMIPFDPGDGESYILMLPSEPIDLQDITKVFIYLNDDTLFGSETIYDSATEITARQVGGVPQWVPKVASFTGSWKHCQVGDIIFLTHSSGLQRPLSIARTAPDAFEINYYDQHLTDTEGLKLSLRPPYTPANVSAITMSASGTTITASAAYFTADMLGSQMRVDVSGTSYVFYISVYTNSTTVTAVFLVGAAWAGASDDWRISMWSNERGWPTSVAYFQQRLFWGGTPLKDYDIIWASRVGQLFHLAADRLDQDSTTDASGQNYFGDAEVTDPLSIRPASQESNAIKWMRGDRVLMVGTSGGEYIVSGFDGSIDMKQNTNYGSSNSQVAQVGKDTIFISANRKSLRSYRYSDENGSWLSDDLSSKSDTLFHGSDGTTDSFIKQISWNSETKQLWVLMSDNKLFTLSRDSEYGIAAWSDIQVGGPAGELVLGVTNIQSNDGTRVETFLMIERSTPNGGGGVRTIYLEKIIGEYINSSMHPTLSTDIVSKYPRFLDYAQVKTANGSGVVDGIAIDFFEQVVDACWFTDDVFDYVLGIEVIAGTPYKLNYTFPANARVIWGYKYDANIKTLPPEAGGSFGSSMADIKHIHESYLKLYRTKDFSIGSQDKESGVELSFEDITYDDLTSTDKKIQTMDNPDTDGQIIVRSVTPTPLNILALVSKGKAYD